MLGAVISIASFLIKLDPNIPFAVKGIVLPGISGIFSCSSKERRGGERNGSAKSCRDLSEGLSPSAAAGPCPRCNLLLRGPGAGSVGVQGARASAGGPATPAHQGTAPLGVYPWETPKSQGGCGSAAGVGCCRAGTVLGARCGDGGARPTPRLLRPFSSSSASRQEEAAPVWLFPLQVAPPTNYSACKSTSGAYSSAINQYKLKGHPVWFCNSAL